MPLLDEASHLSPNSASQSVPHVPPHAGPDPRPNRCPEQHAFGTANRESLSSPVIPPVHDADGGADGGADRDLPQSRQR